MLLLMTSSGSDRRYSFKKLFLKTLQHILKKTPVLESVFNKEAVLQACNFIKMTLQHVLSCEYCQISRNAYLEKHLQKAASEQQKNLLVV